MVNLIDNYPEAERVTVILDNLNAHKEEAFYDYLPSEQTHKILRLIELVYTPEHGSWLDMAETELSVLMGQCLNRRIQIAQKMERDVQAWQKVRNNAKVKIDWRFETKEGRIKLKRLYPTIIDC